MNADELYDSFLLKCDLDDQYGRFGAGLEIGKEGVITEFLGKNCSLNWKVMLSQYDDGILLYTYKN